MNSRPNWQAIAALTNSQLPAQLGAKLWQALSDMGSLTDRVKAQCDAEFSVELLSQTEQTPSAEEAAALGIAANKPAVIRDVYLKNGDVPWVFAHSVMPLETLQGAGKVLGNMGNKPLGAALFSNPLITRGPIEIAALNEHDALYPLAVKRLDNPPKDIWGRRSLFFVDKRPLMVCEFFLPSWIAPNA